MTAEVTLGASSMPSQGRQTQDEEAEAYAAMREVPRHREPTPAETANH